jgi:capsid protein
MALREKIFGWAFKRELGDLAHVQARYEAAYWNLSRTYLPGFIQSARDDINTLSRQEVLRRVRYFEKNSNVLNKVLNVLDVNVVGAGITPSPATAKLDWNKDSLDYFCEWASHANIAGQTTLWEDQSITFRGQNCDGDHFVELTETTAGRPAIALIEGHRIGSAQVDTRDFEMRGYKVIDGVVIDSRGTPILYLVANEFDSSGFRAVPASRMVPFFRKKRAGQYRGISRFFSAILDLHDLDDLQKFEMLAAKIASSRAEYIETAQGGVSASDSVIGRSLQQAPKSGDSAARESFYAKILGGESKVLYPGDKVVQAKSDRPSAAISGFWDKLENKIVQGGGISYAALVDYRTNWGGAALRAAVVSDNRVFELDTIHQSIGWQRVWEYVIEWGMRHGEVPFNPDYKKVRWHPPRRTTVDIGHESKAVLAELQAGLRTYEEIYAEIGEDWREKLEQRAIEEAEIDRLAEHHKVERQYIASFAQERMTPAAEEAAGEEKPETQEES